jgi:hypothetical protein
MSMDIQGHRVVVVVVAEHACGDEGEASAGGLR